jgi:glyceraldehyde 3-phosphate dehydrogenase
MIKIGINGFGRIGRAFLRLALEEKRDMQFVAINDLGNVENLAYLLKYDSVYGKAPFEVKPEGGMLIAGEQRIQVLAEKEPGKLPWGTLGVDVVVESTGLFTDYGKAKAHLDAGAKRVVISAPAKGESPDAHGETILMGLNEDKLASCQITSNASCTTNASSPVIAILDEAIGIEKAVLNTTHSYTATQALIDGPSKKGPREGRAAGLNMIPSSTGAAVAVTQAYTALAGKFDGISIRVPTPAGSIADITFIAKRDTSVEEVNAALRTAAQDPRWKGIFDATDEELVSHDIIGNTHGSIADLTMTRVVGGNLVKVLAWYDNEYGYTHTLLDHVEKAARA